MVTRINVRQVAQQAARAVAGAAGPAARQARSRANRVARQVGDHVKDAVNGSLGLSGERRSKVDTAWLRMDSPSNLMMIVGVWVLQPAIQYEDLCRRIEERLLKYPRFVQRVVQDAAGATWVQVENFDVRRHVVLDTLARKPSGREQEALQDRLAELAGDAAGQGPPALAVPAGRALPGWLCDAGAYPPLHC